MTETANQEISKAEVDKFLFGKHITGCSVCGRFRSQCDVDVHTLTCQRTDPSSTAPVHVLMIVCQNCGAIQFHDRRVSARWVLCQKRVCVKEERRRSDRDWPASACLVAACEPAPVTLLS